MIKPRSAIARIGVGLVIAAGLSLGVPAASFAQEEFDTSQVFQHYSKRRYGNYDLYEQCR